MPLYRKPWDKTDEGKVAFMTRAQTQDVGYRMKNVTLARIFPVKIVNNEDIGPKCCEWAYSILTDLDNDAELQTELLTILLNAYKNGIDPDNWRPWLDYYLLKMQSFANKIGGMSNIAKISFMDKLEKEDKIGADIDEQVW